MAPIGMGPPMMTSEQLTSILAALRDAGSKSGICLVIIDELHRRKHGPLTLSEAVASGKPFRRKAWGFEVNECDGMWITRTSDSEIGLYFCSDVVELFRVEPDDIAATDYELKPEKEE